MPQSLIPNAQSLIAAALAEDIGTGDITSQLLIPEDAQAEMAFVAREEMVACGMFIPGEVYAQIDGVTCVAKQPEGARVKKNTLLAIARGSARSLLAGERVVLNIMQRMCGVATLTARYVTAVRGTKAIILDTRKTMPGMRVLDKYAVKAGGGQNHRMGLYDAVLVKDNHIAIGIRDWGLGIGEVITKTREKILSLNPNPQSLIPIIVECDTLSQVEEALAAAPDRILLDNMDVETMRKAVVLAAGRIALEASGGVSLETVREIAKTGVDYISVGKLTHSAPAVDIGADIVIKSRS